MINNRTTGPTPLPPSVIGANNQQIVGHRSETFKTILLQAREKLQHLLNSKNPPIFLTCSGTGGLEAAILNTLSKNDKVLSLSSGYYGDLFATIAETYLDENIKRLRFSPGKTIDLSVVEDELKKNHYKAILITHNESSTGLLNPLIHIARVIRQYSNAFILVDAISSIGATPFEMEQWDIDVVVTVPQKALMAPPGLAIVCASDRVLSLSDKDVIGSFYFNFKRAYDASSKNQTPSTPCVTSLRALNESLSLIVNEGVSNVFHRHNSLSKLCCLGVKNFGLSIFPDESFSSPSITAIKLPSGISASLLQAELEKKFNLLTAIGLDTWKDEVLRIGHMGYVTEQDIFHTIDSLQKVVHKRLAQRVYP